MIYFKKISETNTPQGQNRGYSTDAFESFRLNFATGRSMKMTEKLRQKVTVALQVQERFRKSFVQKLCKPEYQRKFLFTKHRRL